MKLEDLKVLVVEDDPIYANVLVSQIIPRVNQCASVATAEEGTNYIISDKPNLIFLDEKLPKLDGSEVIRIYKRLDSSVKIVLMSGAFEINSVSKAIQEGADYIIDKSDMTPTYIEEILRATVLSTKEGRPLDSLLKRKVKDKVGADSRVFRIAVVEDDKMLSLIHI